MLDPITSVLSTRAGALRYPKQAAAALSAASDVNSVITGDILGTVAGVLRFPNEAADALASPSWDFGSLADLEYWYDASDLASITAAGGVDVTQWNDKSGNARHLLNGAGDTTRPTTGATLLNGLNVIDVTANHLETMALTTESPILPQPYHMFMVIRATLTPDGTRFCSGMSLANRAMIWGNTTWSLFSGSSGASDIVCNSTGTFFISALFSGAASKIWVNGAAPQTVNAGTQDLGGFRLNGDHDGAGFHLTGSFAEIAICSGDKSADIDTVKTHMAAKWGLSL
jgi:hypothetical protein